MIGAKSSNQLLSERRASAVRDYLIANGINADRLTLKVLEKITQSTQTKLELEKQITDV